MTSLSKDEHQQLNADTHLFHSLEKKATDGELSRSDFLEAVVKPEDNTPDLTNGAQASVTVITSKETDRKYIMKMIGREKNLTREEAEKLIQETREYQRELKAVGIEIPALHAAIAISPEGDGGHQIAMVEDIVGDGKNVKDLFQNPNVPLEEKMQTIQDLTKLILDIPTRAGTRNKTDVGGDFRPANFVKQEGKYVLIDTFAPKRVYADGQVGPYLDKLEKPLTSEAMTFLCSDRRGELSALFYFSLRHVRKDPALLTEFTAAIDKIIADLPEGDVKEYLLEEQKTNYERTSQIYQTADIAHLSESIKKDNQPQTPLESMGEQQAPTSLPDSAMHDSEEVARFVKGYLVEREIPPREIALQMVGVKALQNPGIIKRFITDFEQNREKSSFQGEIGMFVIDDSWDDDKAAEIQQVAAEAGVDYFRVRKETGFANDFISRYGEQLQKDTTLTDAEKKYKFWLARALLKDRLQAPLTNDLENFTFQDPLAELGGIAGTQNFGYLVAAYESGKRGIPLEKMTVTINEDDQRYMTLAQGEEGKIHAETHDYFSERAAWFQDPDTIATVGRYTGHTGNPISMVRDTLQAATAILADHNSGNSNSYNIFEPETGSFMRVDSEQAYAMLPQILRAAAQRQSVIGLWTKDKHYKPLINWEEASKLDLGNVTLGGAALDKITTPLGGVFDYNFSGLLRAQAVQAPDENRLIRREESLMHQRVARASGGDAFGREIATAFNNNYAKEQRKISYVLETDQTIRQEFMQALGIPPERDELFQSALRTFEANGRKLQDIRDLRKLFELQVESSTLHGNTERQLPEVQAYLKSFLEQFPESLIDEVEATVIAAPSKEDTQEIRKAVRRFGRMYALWPELVQTAYEMGLAESKKEEKDEAIATKERQSRGSSIEVGYLPGVSAHTGRPLEVAIKLAEKGVPAVMRGGESGRSVFGLQERWETPEGEVRVANADLYYYHPGELIRGEFTTEQMAANILKIIEQLQENPPPFVLVDHNVPLLMAAKAAGIPSVAITNMSNVGFCSDDFIREIGPTARKLADKYYVPLQPKLQEVYEKVRDKLGLPSEEEKPNWFQMMETGGDLTLIADCPGFVKEEVAKNFDLEPLLQKMTEGKFAYVGSIQPNTIIEQSIDTEATEQALLRMEVAKIAGNKVVFGSFGSIRKPELFGSIADLARNNPNMLVVVTTSDAELPDNLPRNLHALKFGRLPDLAKQSDVLLCQGGSGTLYPFMKEGQGGIINITTNADQQYNAALIEEHQLGATLPLEQLTSEGLQGLVDDMIEGQEDYKERLGKISPKIDLHGAQNAADIIKQRFHL